MKKKSLITTLILFVLALVWMDSPQLAAKPKADESLPASAHLISPVTAIGDLKTVRLGFLFKIRDDWKIYAPNKENATYEDVAPQVSWSGASRNAGTITFAWPQAKETTYNDEVIHYYDGTTVIPFTVDVDDPSKPLILKGILKYVACKKLCVPIEEEIDFVLNPGSAAPTKDAPLLLNEKGTSSHSNTPDISLISMILMAFVGGIILNFMPCVLPILTLKIMTFKKISKHSYDFSYRLRFLASFAGIIVSFLLFAVFVISLKTLGGSVGWGMHFQQPLFLTFMAVVMTLFACNLWGFFEIHLPARAASAINAALGSGKTTYKVLSGDFLSGVFATLLATPCTAPFLGTAIGYSFSKGSLEIFLLFIFLGFGFSTPYWLGLVLPKNWLKFPKAGNWMKGLTLVLGWGLMVTVLWMLWIISKQESLLSSLLIGGLLVGLIMLFWLKSKNIYAKFSLILACFAISLIVPDVEETPEQKAERVAAAFDPAKIQEALDAGKIVFVDVHAKWCLTCQVNHSLVLHTPDVKKLLESDQVRVISADWTLRDDTIASFLEAYGRFGIPFNIVFGPNAPDGIVLSEILSEAEVVNALNAAGFNEKS